MFESFQLLVSAAIGAALKAVWDAYTQKIKEIELRTWQLRAEQLERRLSRFYWPIYLRLQRDNVVWERILDREHPTDVARRDLAYQIEQDVLLPNHAEVIRIIEENIYLAGADKEFEDQIMRYMRHVDVYRSCRAAGMKDKDPLDFGEPYPDEFFEMLSIRLQRYQSEYEQLLQNRGID